MSIADCNPGDVVKVCFYDDDVVEGLFERYWGYPGEDSGWIIVSEDDEIWIDIRDITSAEVIK